MPVLGCVDTKPKTIDLRVKNCKTLDIFVAMCYTNGGGNAVITIGELSKAERKRRFDP